MDKKGFIKSNVRRMVRNSASSVILILLLLFLSAAAPIYAVKNISSAEALIAISIPLIVVVMPILIITSAIMSKLIFNLLCKKWRIGSGINAREASGAIDREIVSGDFLFKNKFLFISNNLIAAAAGNIFIYNPSELMCIDFKFDARGKSKPKETVTLALIFSDKSIAAFQITEAEMHAVVSAVKHFNTVMRCEGGACLHYAQRNFSGFLKMWDEFKNEK